MNIKKVKTSQDSTLTPIIELFKSSFLFLKKNFKSLILITLITLLPVIIIQILVERYILNTTPPEELMLLFAIIMLLSLAAIISLTVIQQIALISFVHNKKQGLNKKIKSAFLAGKNYFISYIWLTLIFTFVILPGIIAVELFNQLSARLGNIFTSKYIILFVSFLILIIIFAIIVYVIYLSINFIFMHFNLVTEDIKGWNAIKKSRSLVKNYFWPVLLRLAALNIILLTISSIDIIIGYIPKREISYILSTFYSLIFFTFAIPFAVIYTYGIYNDLKHK